MSPCSARWHCPSIPRGDRKLREALIQQGPRNRLCRAAGAAAPSGGRELHAVSDRGGYFLGLTLPQSADSHLPEASMFIFSALPLAVVVVAIFIV